MALPAGVTVFVGENASNRSSLLAAVAGALGARPPTLKTDTESGSVAVSFGRDEYGVDLERDGDRVVVDREPYTDAETLCDTFVRLLGDNPLRVGVESLDETELYETLMGPVDTDAVEAEIERLRDERDRLRERLDRYDDLEAERAELETERESLAEELETLESDLSEVEAELETRESSADDAETDLLSELESLRSERRSVDDRIGTHERALDRSESDLSEVESELSELDDGPELATAELPSAADADPLSALPVDGSDTPTDVTDADEAVSEVEAALERRRARKRELDDTVNVLQTVVEVNRRTPDALLDGDAGAADTAGDASPGSPDTAATGDASEHDRSESVTDRLDPASQSVRCWTCGETVERAAIERRTDELASILDETRAERDEVAEEIDRLERHREEWERRRERRRELRERRAELQSEIDDHERTLERLTEERADLTDEIERVEERAEAARERDDDEFVRLHRRANELSHEQGQLRRQLDDAEARIEEIDDTLADREETTAELDRVQEDLETARDRIYRLERETVDTINETMADVVDALGFDNLERVWVERRASETADAGRADGFALHVVRAGDDGTVYEDSLATLSASEREVVGIVLAAAGYLVHEVAETVPVILLDGLEALDADRIRSLLTYLSEHTRYLVATAHPEDREVLEERFSCRNVETALADAE